MQNSLVLDLGFGGMFQSFDEANCRQALLYARNLVLYLYKVFLKLFIALDKTLFCFSTENMRRVFFFLLHMTLTLKAPRKSASENVCLCRLLHLLADFSNLHFAYRQTV